MAKCRYCGKEIFWVKEGKKNVPFENSGDEHSCDERKSSLESFKTITTDSLSQEEIAKYEKAMNDSVGSKKKK